MTEDIVVVIAIAVLVLIGGAVYIIAALHGTIARLRRELKEQTAVIEAQGTYIVLWQQREHTKTDRPQNTKEKTNVWWYDHA